MTSYPTPESLARQNQLIDLVHDNLFNAVFCEPENVMVHFEGFLPEKITSALDLSHGEHVPGSFVEEALSGRHTDRDW